MPEKFEQQEQEKKYTLPDKNIIALGKDSEIMEKRKDFFAALEREGIKWPIEIQGTGMTCADKKEFKVYYPEGDIFASFVVTIHELGHLRQFEADERFEQEEEETPKGKVYTLKNKDDLIDLEKAAWERGLQRVKDYNPEILKNLEKKFKEYKEQGEVSRFENFLEFFYYIREMIESILPINKKIQGAKGEINAETAKSLAMMIKEDPDTYEFFSNPESWRVGEKVNKEEIESFIKKVSAGIADEKYEAS
ncbi:hypothetical protein ACFL2U_02070 [Patescibacteria group bacterium]